MKFGSHIRSCLALSTLVVSLGSFVLPAVAQRVQCSRLASSVDGDTEDLSAREAQRIERFLAHVFPARLMKRFKHSNEQPVARRVTYSIVRQQGVPFVVAGFSGSWREPVNILAIYRLEKNGPNQVWRSRPWDASYYGWKFATAKDGNRTILLFQEGGADTRGFGLASVISFQNARDGVYIRDLTPAMPHLRAYTRFPFRPLYGQEITMRMEEGTKPYLHLSASDELFHLNSTTLQPTSHWRFDRIRHRFEIFRPERTTNSPLTNISSRPG